MLFETDRLYVRLLNAQDIEAFYDLQSNAKVGEYSFGEPMSREACEKDLEKVLNHYKDPNDGFRVWGLCLKDDDELLGTVAIISDEYGNEIGYRIREKFWGQGYGTESTEGLIKYAFEVMNLPNLFAEVDIRNTRSVAILDKTMKRIKEFWNEKDKTQDYLYELSK